MTKEEAFSEACEYVEYDKHAVDINDVFIGEFRYDQDFKDYVFTEFCDLNNISDKITWYLDEDAIFDHYKLNHGMIIKIDNYYFDFSRA